MTVAERIEAIIEHYGINAQRLASMIGAKTKQSIYNLLKGQTRTISAEMQQKIVDAFPEISRLWLITGEGQMLIGSPPNNPDTASCELVPLIPFAACAGSFADYLGEGVSLRQCEMVVTPVKGCSLAIDVTGDSMEPDFPNGCRVFVRKLEDMSFVPWGHTFVVDTDNGAFLKRLFPGDGKMIVAKSINTEYPPFYIPTASIRGIYRVVMMARVFAAT